MLILGSILAPKMTSKLMNILCWNPFGSPSATFGSPRVLWVAFGSPLGRLWVPGDAQGTPERPQGRPKGLPRSTQGTPEERPGTPRDPKGPPEESSGAERYNDTGSAEN